MVDALTEVGLELLRGLKAAAAGRDPVLAYCRLSRSLRLTLMLEARLEAIVEGGAAALAAERATAAAADIPAPEPLETEARAERAQGAETGRERDREAPDEIDAFLTRPLTEVAAAVCEGLGLAPDKAREALDAFADLAANDDGAGAETAPPAGARAGASPARRTGACAGRPPPRPGRALGP